MPDDLPSFGSVQNCPKCGTISATARRAWKWEKGVHSIEEYEYILVFCARCGYVWREATKDAKGQSDT